LVKNKIIVNKLQPGFDEILPGQLSHWIGQVFNYFYFFINLTQFQFWINQISDWSISNQVLKLREKLLEMVPLPNLIDHVDLSADLKLIKDYTCIYWL
jgi:hypothetical protein